MTAVHATNTALDHAENSGLDIVSLQNNPSALFDLVQTQRRRHGRSGVYNLWKDLRRHRVLIDGEDSDLSSSWECLAEVFGHSPDWSWELIQHARETYTDDHPIIVHLSGYLSGQMWLSTTRAWVNAPEPLIDFLSSSTSLEDCLKLALACKDQPAAFGLFSRVYETSTTRTLYDTWLELMKKNRLSFSLVLKWHTLLVSHGDRPTTKALDASIVRILRRRTKHGLTLLETGEASNVVEAEKILRETFLVSRYNIDSANILQDPSKAEPISDRFAARVLATRALPIPLALSGLSMLGLATIGPLAMREIATRANAISDFQAFLGQLEAKNIDLLPCMYNEALRIFAYRGMWDLFSRLAQSDVHPEVFEDREGLRRLSEELSRSGLYEDAHMMLAVLALHSTGSSQSEWEALVKGKLGSADLSELRQIFMDMLSEDVRPSGALVSLVCKTFLPPRERGKRPGIHRQADHLVLGQLADTLLVLENAGVLISDDDWREILKRYGVAWRMEELGSLCISLATIRTARRARGGRRPASHTSSINPLSPPATVPSTPGAPTIMCTASAQDPVSPPAPRSLKTLFTHDLERAIISWSFLAPASSTKPTNPPSSPSHSVLPHWTSGITLLRRLAALGVKLHVEAIRAQVVSRLGMLYTDGDSARRRNRVLKAENQLSLAERVEVIEAAWRSEGGNGSLLKVPPNPGPGSTGEDEWLYRVLFVESGWLRKSGKGMDVARKKTLRRGRWCGS